MFPWFLLRQVLVKDLNTMLSHSFDLVEGIIEISHQRKWLDTCIATIRFSQCLVPCLRPIQLFD